MKIGIVGAGHMGTRHARHFARIPGVTLTAVADGNSAKTEPFAQTYGAKTFSTIEELLAGAETDAVVLCVPTHLHRSLGERALAAGKHVLCEKPLALSVPDCDALIDAAEDANVVLSVGHVVRFFPEYANAKQVVASGALGKPAAVRTRRAGNFPQTDTGWYQQTEQSGGLIFDLLVHDFDWIQWCFGNITRVYARRHTAPEQDYALLTVRTETDVLAHLEGVWSETAVRGTAFEVAGDAGLLTHDSRQSVALSVQKPTITTSGRYTVPPAHNPLAVQDDPYYRQALAFVQTIRGEAKDTVPPTDARQAVAVAEAAQESLRTGKAVLVGATANA